MKMRCRYCKEDREIYATIDSRGLLDARCSVCDRYIKKLNAAEAARYRSEIGSEGGEKHEAENTAAAEEERTAAIEAEPVAKEEKPPCKHCTENYFVRRGRLGTVYAPIEAKFCPMCGRELQDSDRHY